MKSSRNKYGMGTVTRTKAGNWLATISHQNRRYRKTHPTKDEALDWMDRRQAELTREDRTLTARETRDALDALELLDGHGSLTEATRFFLRHHEGSSVTERTLAEAVQEFLEEKRVAGRREATLRSYGDRLGRLARDQGDGLVSDFTGPAFMGWLNANDIGGLNRNSYLGIFATFWRWCERMGYVSGRNPADAVSPASVDQDLPPILTPDQTRDLMTAAVAHVPVLVPYLAIGLFAGVRPDELKRLQWSSLKGEVLHVGPGSAKTRQQRYVTLMPNLVEWLAAYRGVGPICPLKTMTFRRRFKEVRERAEVFDTWSADIMRHSFATYHLALFQDAPRTAHELGHRSPDTLYRHYRNLATGEESRIFFKINTGLIAQNLPNAS